MDSTVLFRRWTLLLLCVIIGIMQCEPSQQNDGRDLMNLVSRQGIKHRNLVKRPHKSSHQRIRRKPKRNQRRKRRNNKKPKRTRKTKKHSRHHQRKPMKKRRNQKLGKSKSVKKPKRTKKTKKHNKHHHRKPTKKRRNRKLGKSNSVFEGSACEWIDLCGLKSRAGNCSNGNKAVIKNAKGARKQFLIAGGKVFYGFVKKGEKFPACQGVTERTSTISCKPVDNSDVAGIQLPSMKSSKKTNKFKHRKRQAYAGIECEYVDICSLTSRGQNCVDGTKFVLKASGGVRKQFLITNNKLILAFVKRGSQFADCQTLTDVTASVTCKAVYGLSGFSLTGSSPSTTTTTTTVAGGSTDETGTSDSENESGDDDNESETSSESSDSQNDPNEDDNESETSSESSDSENESDENEDDSETSSEDDCSSNNVSTTAAATSFGPCTCGRKKVGTRVVGGNPTEVAEYPWMVGLNDQQGSTFYFCAGSLVAAQWVATAAHCIDGKNRLFVTLGDHDMTSDAESVIKTIRVDKIIGHPDYGTNGGSDHDFGLLKLSESVDLNTYTPACLPAAGTDYTGQKGWIVGWGDDQILKQSRTDVLNELELPIVSDSVCQQAFADKGFDHQITSDMVCAGGTRGKDGCYGDSGGPFTVDKAGQHFLVGAVSWGEGCARDGLYGVYSEVAMFREWMDQQIANNGGADYCPESA